MFELIDPEDNSYYCEDIFIIDGIIPNEKIKNNIVLITNLKNNEIKEFLKLNDTSKVYIFEDRQSLDNFKYSLLESKQHLDEGFNAHELISFYNSNSNSMKTLKYIKGIENIKKTKGAILFIDENDVNSINDYSLSDGFYPYIIRDEESSKGLEGYYIIDNKNMT